MPAPQVLSLYRTRFFVILSISLFRSASISQPPSIPYPTIRPDLPIYQQPTIIPQSSTPALLSPQPQLSHTPTPAPILSSQPPILTQAPTTLLSTQPQIGTGLVSNRRRDTPIATHYIECSICHKKRAVPMYISSSFLFHSLDQLMKQFYLISNAL